MDEKRRKIPWRLIYLPVLFFLLLLFAGGCADYARVVGTTNRLPLIEDKREQGTFSNDGISLHYRYELRGESLSLEGGIGKGRGIDFFKIHLLFLDNQGKVVSGKFIYSSTYRTYTRMKREGEFARTVNVPAGAAAISFDFYVEHRIRR